MDADKIPDDLVEAGARELCKRETGMEAAWRGYAPRTRAVLAAVLPMVAERVEDRIRAGDSSRRAYVNDGLEIARDIIRGED